MADAYGVTKKSETGSLQVRANKLAPKLELMTYIGYETGVKGWRFMQ